MAVAKHVVSSRRRQGPQELGGADRDLRGLRARQLRCMVAVLHCQGERKGADHGRRHSGSMLCGCGSRVTRAGRSQSPRFSKASRIQSLS